jgi:hypothetical protein
MSDIRATWTTAYINSLGDDCFLYIESGGKKDKEGKTTPRSLRHLPYKNKEGKVDLPHLRAALSRLGQEGTGEDWLSDSLRENLISKARSILKRETGDDEGKAIDMSEVSDTKATSLDERRRYIGEQWENTAGYGSSREPSPVGGWLVEVFEDYVIIQSSGRYWRVAYSETEDGIEFAEVGKWIEMRQKWVRKGAEMVLTLSDHDEATLTPEGDEQDSVEDVVSIKASDEDCQIQDELDAASEDGDSSEGDCGFPSLLAVRALGEKRVGTYCVLWGNSEERDFYDEYFTPDTQDMRSVFEAVGKVPLFYHHGMDGQMKSAVIGLVDVMEPDSVGLWYEAQVRDADEYMTAVRKLIGAGRLGTSTGCMPGTRSVSKGGKIKRWTIAEVSLTPRPAEYRMRTDYPIEELRALYKSVGLRLPEDVDDSEGEGVKEARQREIDIELELLDLVGL